MSTPERLVDMIAQIKVQGTICPKCGNEAISRFTVSPEYRKIECHNQVEVMISKKPVSQSCGYHGFVKIQKKGGL